MLDPTLKSEVESLSWFAKSSFKYLSEKKLILLTSISKVTDTIAKTKDSPKMKSSDLLKSQFDEEWTAKLNQPEFWKKLIQDNLYSTYQIEQLQDFWDKQKAFAACSNDFLLKSLETINFSLYHIQKAHKEFKQYGSRLPRDFAAGYGQSLHDTYDALIQQRQMIVNAMLSRLKIASIYGNLACERRQNVDDAVFYVTDHLTVLSASDDTSLFLQAVPPRASLNENHYIQFYDAIKKYGENDVDEHGVDKLHWSHNLGTKATLLSVATFKKAKNKADKKINMPQCGLIFVKTGEDNQTQIVVPRVLEGLIPVKRRSPAWYYWQEHKVLDFWEKRQSFLFKLHDLWSDHIDASDQTLLSKINEYQKLIQEESQNLRNEQKSISIFAFALKNMIQHWLNILNHLSFLADNQFKEAADQNHQKRFVDDLKRSQPISIPAAKNYPLKKPVISVQKPQHQTTRSKLQEQSRAKNTAIKQKLIAEQTQAGIPDNDHHQRFFKHG